MPTGPDPKENFFQAVHQQVRRIPSGKVAAYGQIARLIGRPGSARTVGWAMRALPRGSDVPWHRVVNAQGRLSLTERSASLQRALLESEGVRFNAAGQIDMKRFRWNP